MPRKRLLTKKGVSYQEFDVSGDMEKRQEMMKRANGRHTVPQIFVGAEHIGGYDDLSALDRRGALDVILAG